MEFSYEIGIAAGVCFVVAYGLLNLIGAVGFTYTAISPFNPGLFIVEALWAIVAAFGIYKIVTRKPKVDTTIAAHETTAKSPRGNAQ